MSNNINTIQVQWNQPICEQSCDSYDHSTQLVEAAQ